MSEKSHSERKVTVLKLKPEDLKMLALTNLKLSELYKLKEIYQNNKHIEAFTYNNLTMDVPILNKEAADNQFLIPPLEGQDIYSNTLETVQNIIIPNVNTISSIEHIEQEVNAEALLETEIIK